MKNRILAAVALTSVLSAAFAPQWAVRIADAAVQQDAAASAEPQDPSEGKVVESVEFRGNRRIPSDSVRLWVQTREGEPYSADQIRRDVRTILAQGFFEDAKVFAEEGDRGGVKIIYDLKEYPVILDIDYPGLKSVSQSDLLEEWRKRSIGLSKEAQLDPIKANRAAAAIRDLLAAKGRPDAVVKWEPEEVSATAVFLHFNVEEGERVRIAEIDFEGNTAFSDGDLRSQMRLVKQVGILAGLTSKDIYDKEKLKADLERVRFYYADHGYIAMKYGDPVVEDAGRVGSGLPLVGGTNKGLKVTVPIDEGRVYRVGEVTVEGETVYTEEVIKAVIGLTPGEIVRSSEIQKGVFENLKKLYGERGYIQFEPVFSPDLKDDPNDPKTGVADFHFQLEEGKSFSVHRIEFKGNTYTRDNVLRREVLVNEGDPYNQRYWDLSLLRLNQLGYFNEIKDTDADIRTNQKDGTVDIDLRVQEKGRQQIQFTGGISGIGGSFVGLQYSTNNLLGYGEGLTFDVSAGNRTKNFTFGFSEPYVLGRPISAGFQLFFQKYQYFGNGVRLGSNGLTPDNSALFNGFGTNGEELFTQTRIGGSVSISAPVGFFFKRSTAARFSRVGLSYTYVTSSIEDPAVNRDGDPTNDILVTFRESGIKQSTITPTFSYNTLNASLDPTRGQELSLGISISGGPLGGDVNTIQPTAEYKFFHPVNLIRKNQEKPDVFGMRLLAGHVRSFGTPFESNSLSFIGGTPIFSRFFLGGEDTLRGFDVRAISPVSRVERFVTTQNVIVQNSQGDTLNVLRPRQANRRSVAPSVIRTYTVTDQKINGAGQAVAADDPRFDSYTPIGADTQLLGNFEYRVPIVGPVTVAAFFDIGSAFNLVNLQDKSSGGEFIPLTLGPFVVVNPRGQLATQDEIKDATTPETPVGALPRGFRTVTVFGDRRDETLYRLSEDTSSLFSNYRYSVGTEIRVQVPVINVPFRLIFAYNPNAKTGTDPGQVFREERTVIRFSVGRTF